MLFDKKIRLKCSECPIRHSAVCARCDEDELAILDDIKNYKNFRAGETILYRGNDLTYVASIVSGVATLGKSMEDGRTQMVGLLFPSDFIGRPGRVEIDFDVVAATDVTLCCFQRIPFQNLLGTTPHIAQRLLEMALDELDAARDWMVLLGRKTAREKIATFVTMLSRRQLIEGAIAEQSTVMLPLTRDVIANYLGLTLETVSRQLNAMKQEGILRFTDRKRFEVADFEALYLATGGDTETGSNA